MSEQFQKQIVLKMAQGTPRGDVHLCPSCSSGIVRRGCNASEDLQVCGVISQLTGGRRGVVHGAIAQCSHYYPKALPALHELQEIAWEIVTKGRKIGFISPSDRRQAGIGGTSIAPAPRW